MRTRFGLPAFALLLTLSTMGVPIARSQAPADARQRVPRFAYVFGEMGEFVKINLETAESVAHGWLPRMAGLANVVPPDRLPSTRTTEGVWTPIAAVSDPARETIFLAVPVAADGVNTFEEHRILALQLPDLNLRGVIPIPARPTLFVGRESLFVNYTTESNDTRIAARLDAYDLRSLSRTKRYDQSVDTQAYTRAEADLATLLDHRASVLPAEDAFVDGGRHLVRGATLEVARFNVLAMLTTEQRRRLQPFEVVEPVSKRAGLPFLFVGAAGNRAVYRVGRSTANQTGVVVVDATGPRILSVFEVPFGEVRVTTDGRLAIVEERELRPEAPPSAAGSVYAFSTGRVSRYDLETGGLRGQISDAVLSGRGSWHTSVCVGGADDPVVFAADADLVVIDWTGNPRVRRTRASLPDAARAQCVFAAQ